MIKEFFRAALVAGLMLGALSASAAPAVTLIDAATNQTWSGAANGCSTLVSFDVNDAEGIKVKCSGGGGSLSPSTKATFVITPSKMSTVTGASGSVSVSIIRLIAAGDVPGSDTVTLAFFDAGTTSPAPSTFSSVTFVAADGHVSSKPAGSVTFAAAGTATFSLTGVPAQDTANKVNVNVVSPAVDWHCKGFANPDSDTLSSLAAGSKGLKSFSSATEKPVAAFKFTLPASGPTSYIFTFQANGPLTTFRGKDVAISACPGDFSATGMSNPGQCFVYNTRADTGITITTGGSTGCVVSAGSSYYLNVRSRDVGETMSFELFESLVP